MTKRERQDLFEKYGGRCAYCGCELEKGWHADHIEPVIRDQKWCRDKRRLVATGELLRPENETFDNYNPSCPSCNIQKGSMSLEQFRKVIQDFPRTLHEYHSPYRIAKRYGLVEETGARVIFHFEATTGGTP